MNALIIKRPWIDYILDGNKIWEIRGSKTNIRGDILFIQSGSGLVVGKGTLVDCIELSLLTYRASKKYHCIENTEELPYKKTYAWVIKHAERMATPQTYKHPKGAIIWVKI